jgi:NitT/TauT family transport system ATP-binding protein
VHQIEFRNVNKRFPSKRESEPPFVVQNLSLAIQPGEVVSVIGPSGCGKSTLLNMGAGLYLPTSGEVYVEGERVTKPLKKTAFMLQKDLLMGWRTIRQNVELGLEIDGVDAEKRKAIALDQLKRCHLAGFEDHYPYQLSGGMRQRAALARTMATDPHVLLMDEPFSALDAQTKMVLQQDLARTLFEQKKTALFITHDLAEGVALSDRVLVMSHRPGTIIREMVIDIPDRHDPMSRRKHHQHRLGELVAELMDLLHIGGDTEVH